LTTRGQGPPYWRAMTTKKKPNYGSQKLRAFLTNRKAERRDKAVERGTLNNVPEGQRRVFGGVRSWYTRNGRKFGCRLERGPPEGGEASRRKQRPGVGGIKASKCVRGEEVGILSSGGAKQGRERNRKNTKSRHLKTEFPKE